MDSRAIPVGLSFEVHIQHDQQPVMAIVGCPRPLAWHPLSCHKVAWIALPGMGVDVFSHQMSEGTS